MSAAQSLRKLGRFWPSHLFLSYLLRDYSAFIPTMNTLFYPLIKDRRGEAASKRSLDTCPFSGMHDGQCNKWPRRFVTKRLNSIHADATARTLMVAGYSNCVGDESIMVDTYEHSSKALCQDCSVVANAPRFSSSTSYRKTPNVLSGHLALCVGGGFLFPFRDLPLG